MQLANGVQRARSGSLGRHGRGELLLGVGVVSLQGRLRRDLAWLDVPEHGSVVRSRGGIDIDFAIQAGPARHQVIGLVQGPHPGRQRHPMPC